jgi:hypothetical protein
MIKVAGVVFDGHTVHSRLASMTISSLSHNYSFFSPPPLNVGQSSVTRSNLDTDEQKRSPTQHIQTTLKRAAKLLPSIHRTVQTKAHRVWVEATGDAGYSEPLTDLKARQADHGTAEKDLNDHLDPAQDQPDRKES